MKIKYPSSKPPKLISLGQLYTGNTYRDHRTGHIWLATASGFVDLTENRVVCRIDNMPGFDDGLDYPRYEKVYCVIEVQEG